MMTLRVVGKRGQLSLGKDYAGKAMRVDRRKDGSMLLTPVAFVPESQMWTEREPDKSRIDRALKWAATHKPRATDLDELEKLWKRAHAKRKSHKP